MKFRFDRQEMGDALRTVATVANPRSPKDVFKCVYLDVKSDVVLLSATDQELGIRHAVSQVEVDETGEVLVSADTFTRIVTETTDDVLNIELVDKTLHVRGSGSHFQIVTRDTADFPPVPIMEGNPSLTIGMSELARMIEWTVFSAARESTRYAINGVLWEVDGETLTMAATDGRRLSLARGKIESAKAEERPQAIVPGKALSLLAKLPADAETRVGITVTSNQFLADVGRAQISSTLVEGHFPKYQDVIPTDCDRMVVLNTNEFLHATKQAALLTNEESKGVRLALSDGELTLSSRAPEQGEATVSLPVKYSGEPLEIGFNPVFLTDVLRIAHEDDVTLELAKPNRPGVIRIGDDFVYVVMPVNLASGAAR
ncbi:MAG: DNA polymerase III subunit beta [Planctomycetes bacterium]|nr:DNA polymerase III subunit beta [Planctomycetota bacterium]